MAAMSQQSKCLYFKPHIFLKKRRVFKLEKFKGGKMYKNKTNKKKNEATSRVFLWLVVSCSLALQLMCGSI